MGRLYIPPQVSAPDAAMVVIPLAACCLIHPYQLNVAPSLLYLVVGSLPAQGNHLPPAPPHKLHEALRGPGVEREERSDHRMKLKTCTYMLLPAGTDPTFAGDAYFELPSATSTSDAAGPAGRSTPLQLLSLRQGLHLVVVQATPLDGLQTGVRTCS